MRRLFPVAVLAMLWGWTPSNAEETMAQRSIDQANARLVQLQKQADAEGMGDMYTQDGILLPGEGKKYVGREAIQGFWADMLGTDGVEDVELTTEKLVPLGDDLAYEIGSYETTPKEGEPMTGHYLVIWKRVGGEWKLHADIFNK